MAQVFNPLSGGFNLVLAGAVGPQGPAGTAGTAGAQGPPGDAGAQGAQGIQGLPGADGAAGSPGADGAQGIQGLLGADGAAGAPGTPGVKGDIGDTGPQGIPGTPGATGDQGAQGIQGIQGIQGPAGADGAPGSPGAQGIQGIQGEQGPAGDVSGAWPIGSVFISVVSTNPNTLLGFGTWAAFAAGRVLVGLDSGDVNFDAVEETGGAKTVASSVQTFAGNASTDVVNHVHTLATGTGASGNFSQVIGTVDTSSGGTGATPTQTALGTRSGNPVAGGVASYTPTGTNTPGAATSVVQPYIVVYMWKRTA